MSGRRGNFHGRDTRQSRNHLHTMTRTNSVSWKYPACLDKFVFLSFADSNELRNMHRNSLAAVNSHFITKNSTRVISQRGGLAILPCSVTMTQPATVSKYLYYFKILSKTTPQEIHCESDKSNRSSVPEKEEAKNWK